MKPALTALGVINALGQGKQTVLAGLLTNSALGMQPQSHWLPERTGFVGAVTETLPVIPATLSALDCRNNQLLLAAITEIQDAIDQAKIRYGTHRIGVVLGSSTSGILAGEIALSHYQQHKAWPPSFDYRQQEIGTAALFVSQLLSLRGPAYTISTACSSSAKALASAQRLLTLGLCDAVICGGADTLCKLTLNGFAALESLSDNRCEPFAQHRDGITIGEGAAIFLMEKLASEHSICLAGAGESADAHHISAPHPDGNGAEAAMRAALQQAGLTPQDIHYINLHGTATPLNDAMESQAVRRLFGSAVPCSSTKPLTGHTLGAAGATEAALCWLLLSNDNTTHRLPAQCNTLPRDRHLPDIGLLTTAGTLPATGPRRALSNSFAFGGSNASLILERFA